MTTNYTLNSYGAPPATNPSALPRRAPSQPSTLPGAFPTQSTPLLAGYHIGADHPPTWASSLKFLILDDYLNILLVFLPLGLGAAWLEWSAPTVFALNFLALRAGLVNVVQASLLGSVLSNLLLVLGLSFLCGGFRYSEQSFNETAAQTSASLLAITVCAFVLPAAFKFALVAGHNGDAEALLLNLSRGTAIVLFLMYILYLFFQLKTHKHLYESNEEDETKPQMSLISVVTMLVVVTLAVAFSAEFLVESIEGISKSWHLSETFLGLVVIPIVGNAAEHMTAVTVAMKNKMDLSISIAIGSSLQICLFATPFCVLTGWILNQPMSMAFGVFETAVVFTSVYVSNWLEGAMLLSAYAIITIAFYMI
ncbi:Sodium/calcium exchanger protein-domain-containing protein [Chytridium lagenaria]|nr:Sodium/calcium exchanger protein-domain-containing protein [Chytridium lagenaria]